MTEIKRKQAKDVAGKLQEFIYVEFLGHFKKKYFAEYMLGDSEVVVVEDRGNGKIGPGVVFSLENTKLLGDFFTEVCRLAQPSAPKLEVLDDENRKASPGKFLASVMIDSEPYRIGEDYASFEEAKSVLYEYGKGQPCQIYDDKGNRML